MSLFSRKAYDKLITMTGKKVECPCSLVSYSHFSNDRAQYQGKFAMFSVCTCTSALNDAINYAQKGCAMQYWRMTLTESC